MRPVETVHRKLGSHAKVHLLAVPLMAKDAATAFVAQWKRTLTLPIAHDAAGTATASYVTAHGQSSPFLPSVMPLAFVVGPDGVIRWQGHPNRKAFAASALATTLLHPLDTLKTRIQSQRYRVGANGAVVRTRPRRELLTDLHAHAAHAPAHPHTRQQQRERAAGLSRNRARGGR